MAGCDTGSCETTAQEQACGSSRGGCPCGQAGCSGDPVDCAQGLWSSSFFAAMQQAQVALLRERIEKAWGAKMSKAADAVIEAMGAQWQSMLAQAQAKETLRGRLRALWDERK